MYNVITVYAFIVWMLYFLVTSVIGLTYLSMLVERYNPEGEAVKGGNIVHSRGGEGKGAGGVRYRQLAVTELGDHTKMDGGCGGMLGERIGGAMIIVFM